MNLDQLKASLVKVRARLAQNHAHFQMRAGLEAERDCFACEIDRLLYDAVIEVGAAIRVIGLREAELEHLRAALKLYRPPFNSTGGLNFPVIGCARCGLDHLWVEFHAFIRNEDNSGFSHYGICPTNGQPILMAVKR